MFFTIPASKNVDYLAQIQENRLSIQIYLLHLHGLFVIKSQSMEYKEIEINSVFVVYPKVKMFKESCGYFFEGKQVDFRNDSENVNLIQDNKPKHLYLILRRAHSFDTAQYFAKYF